MMGKNYDSIKMSQKSKYGTDSCFIFFDQIPKLKRVSATSLIKSFGKIILRSVNNI